MVARGGRWLVFAVGIPCFLSAADWHVDNMAGRDDNDGRHPSSAFASILRALEACAPGDSIVLARSGKPYHEGLVLSRTGGTPGTPLVIQGNGAVLSGFGPLPSNEWQMKSPGLWWHPMPVPHRRSAYLRFDGQRIAKSASSSGLEPRAYVWDESGVLLRLPPDESPAGLKIDGTLIANGVSLYDASFIRVENLVAEGFANDGFNVHGDCQGIVFQTIEARDNGDDGFSVHEDGSTVVFNGWFHGNDYGIQDVHAARSSYFGVLVENNRVNGAEFLGGVHVLTDAVVRNNGGAQIKAGPYKAGHIGLSNANLSTTGILALKNVLCEGGRVSLEAESGSQVAAVNCAFSGAAAGILGHPGSKCHITATTVSDCVDLEMDLDAASVELDNNVYTPGRFRWRQKRFEPAEWEAFRDATGQDKASRLGPASEPGADSLTKPQLQPGLTGAPFRYQPFR